MPAVSLLRTASPRFVRSRLRGRLAGMSLDTPLLPDQMRRVLQVRILMQDEIWYRSRFASRRVRKALPRVVAPLIRRGRLDL